jgi:hypothetical protein
LPTRTFWIALVVSACCLRPVAAQDSGALRGRVTSPEGEALAGVTLSLGSAEAAVEGRVAVSGADGAFSIQGLPAAGDYVLRATLPGYATVILTEIAVRPGQVTSLDLTLSPAELVREHVQVRAAGSVVALDDTTTTTRLSSEYLDALPILGRNYQEVLTLAPGVTDVDGDGNPNIHGARDTDVGTLVDGINTTDPLTGKVGMQMNIDALQDIEVKTAGASAEFGRAQGGFANVLTKSGGNAFEGTFKFYWRGSRLDGDGAGQDDPSLHGGLGPVGLRDLSFNDYLPFLSLGGPLVQDRAWYFVSIESINRQDPVNAVSQTFVATTRELRTFVKGTWQATPNTRLSLVFNSDPAEQLSQGLDSLTLQESGYTLRSGGPMLTLRGTSILSPTVALDSAASYMETRPGLTPTLGPDTNGNGILYDDRNGDGFYLASERDAGEDYDGDGAFDVWEDTLVPNGRLDQKEVIFCHDSRGVFRPVNSSSQCRDQPQSYLVDEDGFRVPRGIDNQYYAPPGDGDHRLTPPGGCEGASREDIDCDGHLDRVNEDTNGNGRLDPGEDLDGDGHLDLGTEDRNGNGRLDDTPFPTTTYPYGHLTPVPADREYTINLRNGVKSGPYYEEYRDNRSRGSLRQDLTVFIPDFRGTHDLKVGYLIERESFHRESSRLPVTAVDDPGYRIGTLKDQVDNPNLHYDCNPYLEVCQDPGLGRVTAILPVASVASEDASGFNAGVYVQDTFRPMPNLSIGLGLRYDNEHVSTSGYTPFDPAEEAARSHRILALASGQAGQESLLAGGQLGIQSLGIGSDPLFGDPTRGGAFLADLVSELRKESLKAYIHPQSDLVFNSPAMAKLYPELFGSGRVDPAALRALGLPLQVAEPFDVTNANLAPRLSVSWDPAGSGRTKLFATWGRYYDRLFLSSVTGEQGLQTVQRYYVLDRDGVNVTNTAAGAPPVIAPDHGFGALLSSSPPTVTQVARDLKTPFSDELTLGFEHEIAPEVALSVRYIRRAYRDQLQDIDVNHEVRIDPATGQLSDQFGLLNVVGAANDPERFVYRAPDGRPDLFIRNVFFNQVLQVGNFNDAFYHGVEVELRRRLSRRWQLEGSYTYSRAMGQAESFQSSLGNDPSSVESEYGYLDYDQRHVVKVHALFYLPHDWQIGSACTWASGLPYSVITRFFAHDNADYQQFRTRYGYTDTTTSGAVFVTLPRNSERNLATFNADVSAQRHFVAGHTTWTVQFDVFNLLNSDDLWIQSVEESPTVTAAGGTLATVPLPTQLDATRRFGRRYQVGFRVDF